MKKSKKKAEESTKNMKAKQQVISFGFIAEIFITMQMLREVKTSFSESGTEAEELTNHEARELAL